MRMILLPAAMALAMTAGLALTPTNALAKGCVKGAVVGGVAGHVAGHHGLVGAGAGCAIGHHEASKKQEHSRHADADTSRGK